MYQLRRWRHVFMAVLLLTLVGATAVQALSGRSAAEEQQLRDSLQATGANALLAAQQLDAVFNEIVREIPLQREIAAADQALLRTWLRFDEKFLEENSHRPEVRFERALVARRIGHVDLLLRDVNGAQRGFQNAIALLEELAREQPTVSSFLAEAAETHVRLGWARRQAGDFAEAVEEYEAARRLLASPTLTRDPTYLPNPNLDRSLIETYMLDSQADLALQRGARADAVKYRVRVVALLRQLAARFPDVIGYRNSLQAAEDQLEATRQPVLPP